TTGSIGRWWPSICAAAMVLAGGCGRGTSGPSGDGGDMARAAGAGDLAGVPAECSGTLAGAVQGRFGCRLSMSSQPGEQDLNLATMNFMGDVPKQLALVVVTPGTFMAKRYDLASLGGTSLKVVNKLSAIYLAQND